MITEEEDMQLRRYARFLHIELGEDAYHIVVCDMLSKDTISNIRNNIAFFHVAIRRALYKLFRHEKAERENIEHYLNDDPIPAHRGLVNGRGLKLPTCRKGHEWKIETISYIGKQRTCRICKREREKIAARIYRQNMRVVG